MQVEWTLRVLGRVRFCIDQQFSKCGPGNLRETQVLRLLLHPRKLQMPGLLTLLTAPQGMPSQTDGPDEQILKRGPSQLQS